MPMDADNPTIRWSSNAPSIVSVVEDSTDIVTIKGVQEGNAIIKAAATDGSGVEATCNVVVKPAGPTPYPEGAAFYLNSVQDDVRTNIKFPSTDTNTSNSYKYWFLNFTKPDGDEMKLTYDSLVSSVSTYTLHNLTKGTEEKIRITSDNDPYIIGSLYDNSYIRLGTYLKTFNRGQTYTTTYVGNNTTTNTNNQKKPIRISNNDVQRIIMGFMPYDFDEAGYFSSEPRITNYKTFDATKTGSSYYTSTNTEKVFVRGAADTSSTGYELDKYIPAVGYEPNPIIIKINNTAANGKLYVDYHYYCLKTYNKYFGKLQNEDGTYTYIDQNGSYINEEDTPFNDSSIRLVEYDFDVR